MSGAQVPEPGVTPTLTRLWVAALILELSTAPPRTHWVCVTAHPGVGGGRGVP